MERIIKVPFGKNKEKIKELEKQEQIIYCFWGKLITKTFDAIEIFSLSNPPYGKRKNIRILTHSVRDADVFQLTFLSKEEDPQYHFRYEKSDINKLIIELLAFCHAEQNVYVDILRFPDASVYQEAVELYKKFYPNPIHVKKKLGWFLPTQFLVSR